MSRYVHKIETSLEVASVELLQMDPQLMMSAASSCRRINSTAAFPRIIPVEPPRNALLNY
jgi:hypothetical protein